MRHPFCCALFANRRNIFIQRFERLQNQLVQASVSVREQMGRSTRFSFAHSGQQGPVPRFRHLQLSRFQVPVRHQIPTGLSIGSNDQAVNGGGKNTHTGIQCQQASSFGSCSIPKGKR